LDKYLLLCALTIAIVGAIKDVRVQRIPNWLTYSGLIAALVVRLGLGGWTGLRSGLAGMLFAGLLEHFPNEATGCVHEPTDDQLIAAQAQFLRRVLLGA
jgi:pheromone shutdown protein TraB